MSSYNKKKSQLNMNPSTAAARLRKSLLFSMAQKLEEDYCFQCGAKIDSIDNFSIEHKIPWLDSDNPEELFFNLDNIAFSHLSCNCSASRKTKEIKHPSEWAYRKGCRCEECKKVHSNRIQRYRKNKQ